MIPNMKEKVTIAFWPFLLFKYCVLGITFIFGLLGYLVLMNNVSKYSQSVSSWALKLIEKASRTIYWDYFLKTNGVDVQAYDWNIMLVYQKAQGRSLKPILKGFYWQSTYKFDALILLNSQSLAEEQDYQIIGHVIKR